MHVHAHTHVQRLTQQVPPTHNGFPAKFACFSSSFVSCSARMEVMRQKGFSWENLAPNARLHYSGPRFLVLPITLGRSCACTGSLKSCRTVTRTIFLCASFPPTLSHFHPIACAGRKNKMTRGQLHSKITRSSFLAAFQPSRHRSGFYLQSRPRSLVEKIPGLQKICSS